MVHDLVRFGAVRPLADVVQVGAPWRRGKPVESFLKQHGESCSGAATTAEREPRHPAASSSHGLEDLPYHPVSCLSIQTMLWAFGCVRYLQDLYEKEMGAYVRGTQEHIVCRPCRRQ